MENLDTNEQFEQPKATSGSTALYYGLIGGVVLCILAVVSFMLNLDDSVSWLGNVLNIIVFIVFTILAIKAHRDQKQAGSISFGKAFGVGFLTVIVMAVIGSIFTFVYLQFIDPSIIAEAEREVEKQMAKQDMPREDMERALKFGKMFVTPIAISIMAAILNLIIGVIISLIGAAIYQREN